ncbi:hypothetical protein BK128_08350 [Viridibacillus sp. FSL H7-0596]|uniref:hypothetical protein n=1 Tax=Viridibacillus sp. FSL H7-0596 TaxID=1928923 RepID=UPI00096DAB3E|nr:hypothetical protein [Viridibacillus sp. FSL H7-0596]OMC87428.1 hypothetical protein BK128_08350 [Viridibacillus sp. FSL H7-0596]
MFTNVESTELISSVENIMAELKKRLDPSYVEAQKNAEVDGDNVIQHKGLKLRKVEREAREGDYVRPTAKSDSDYILKDEIYGPVSKLLEIQDRDGDNWSVYKERFNRTTSTVEVFKPIGHRKPVEYEPPFPEVLTPNEQRALLIKQAKEFVEGHIQKTKVLSPMPFSKLKIGSKLTRGIGYKGYVVEEQFISNAKKRTVVCLLRGVTSSNVRSRGIAKCAPGEVFNEHIGQAIALARALEIEVPEEFLKAVQPDEKVVGMVIKDYIHEHRNFKLINNEEKLTDSLAHIDSPVGKDGIIIDDTNAEYNNA